jgi:hypothetical protein
MKTVKLSVDRLEEEKAVLLAKGMEEEIIFPRTLLPPQVKEGDILNIVIEISKTETEKARADVQALLERLKKRTSND